jgi:hypothetical protein
LKVKVNMPFSFFSMLLVVGILLNSLRLEDPIYDFRQGLTFFALAFLGISFFSSSQILGKLFIKALFVLVTVNAISLVCHWLLGIPSAYLASPGRYATWFSQPGNLGVSAFVVLFYLLLRIFERSSIDLKNAGFLLFSVIVLIGENSRTLLLQIILSCILLFYINKKKIFFYLKKRFNYFFMGFTILSVAVSAFFPALLESRAGNIVSQLFQFNFIGIESEDETRFSMWNFVANEIGRNFLFGNGIGETKIPLNVNGISEMQVHAGVFQMWADAGLLAFIGYSGMILTSLFLGHRALKLIYLYPNDSQLIKLALIYSWGFAVTNFLHTYSVVWAQWVYLCFSWGVIAYYSDKRKRSRFDSNSNNI